MKNFSFCKKFLCVFGVMGASLLMAQGATEKVESQKTRFFIYQIKDNTFLQIAINDKDKEKSFAYVAAPQKWSNCNVDSNVIKCDDFSVSVDANTDIAKVNFTDNNKMVRKNALATFETLTQKVSKKVKPKPSYEIESSKEILCSNNQNIQSYINDFYQKDFTCKTAISTFKPVVEQDVKEILADKESPEDTTAIYDSLEIRYFDKDIITFKELNYFYSGGAHGMSNTALLPKIIFRGKIVNLEGLISDFNNPQLKDLLWKKYEELSKQANITDFTTQADFEVTKNIGFIAGGISFTYQPYEIFPYSFGAVDLVLSYAEILNFINNSHPLYELIQQRAKTYTH